MTVKVALQCSHCGLPMEKDFVDHGHGLCIVKCTRCNEVTLFEQNGMEYRLSPSIFCVCKRDRMQQTISKESAT